MVASISCLEDLETSKECKRETNEVVDSSDGLKTCYSWCGYVHQREGYTTGVCKPFFTGNYCVCQERLDDLETYKKCTPQNNEVDDSSDGLKTCHDWCLFTHIDKGYTTGYCEKYPSGRYCLCQDRPKV